MTTNRAAATGRQGATQSDLDALARTGTAVLVAGSKVVADTSVTANSRIFLTCQSLGTVGTPQALGVTARTPGVSFTITSAGGTDTSTIAYHIVEGGL